MRGKRLKLLSTISRVIVGVLFVFSGFVKVIDPWGTALKVNEYLSIYGLEWFSPMSMSFSIWLCGAEMMMGLMLLSRVRIRLVSIFALVSISFFTVLTFLSATWIPVEDCGCFGDALRLTPWETFFKNLVTLPLVIIIWYRYRPDKIFVFKPIEVMLTCLFFAIPMGIGAYCYYHKPLIDFLPYKEGAHLYEMIQSQHDTGSEAMDEEEYVLVYRNRRTGKLREFSIDDKEWQNDKKWEWVETRVDNEASPIQTLVSEFSISDAEGDATEPILTRKGKVYMICITTFDKVSNRCAERLRRVVELAASEDALVVCLTPQPLKYVTWHSFADSEQVRCYNIDATVMKTMLRAENGLVVLEDGVIAGKYNCRSIDFIK